MTTWFWNGYYYMYNFDVSSSVLNPVANDFEPIEVQTCQSEKNVYLFIQISTPQGETFYKGKNSRKKPDENQLPDM